MIVGGVCYALADLNGADVGDSTEDSIPRVYFIGQAVHHWGVPFMKASPPLPCYCSGASPIRHSKECISEKQKQLRLAARSLFTLSQYVHTGECKGEDVTNGLEAELSQLSITENATSKCSCAMQCSADRSWDIIGTDYCFNVDEEGHTKTMDWLNPLWLKFVGKEIEKLADLLADEDQHTKMRSA